MNLFFWRKNKHIDVFAGSLANELYSAVQPEQMKKYLRLEKGDKKAQKEIRKIESQFNNAIKLVQQFRATHSLGVYGKARLHLKFIERLEELGYDKNSAKKVNEIILLKTP